MVIIASFIGSRVQQLVLLRAPEQLLMVAGSTSNVLAEQCVTRVVLRRRRGYCWRAPAARRCG